MNPHEQPCQTTPDVVLCQQILDSRVPKNEREWWASREIGKLETELAAAKAEIENLIWNLAGCSTIAQFGKPTDYSHELARPALHDVNRLAARAEKAENEVKQLTKLLIGDNEGALLVSDLTEKCQELNDRAKKAEAELAAMKEASK